MSEGVLEARSVSCQLGGRAILADVDLALEVGRLTAVVGPNGAGKTTLVRILSGVQAPDGGQVELAARPLARWSRRDLARALAVVPQELSVSFPYRVREMVAMGRAPRLGPLGREGPGDWAAVDAAIRELGLERFAARLFPTLSGGERQRVALARARAQDAPCLLLDEPTAHMDLGHRLHAFEWLRAWIDAGASGRPHTGSNAGAPGGRAALVVTHDLDLAAAFADHVIVLDAGTVVTAGPPAQALTEDTIASVYRVEASVRLGPTGRPEIVARRSRIVYAPSRHE